MLGTYAGIREIFRSVAPPEMGKRDGDVNVRVIVAYAEYEPYCHLLCCGFASGGDDVFAMRSNARVIVAYAGDEPYCHLLCCGDDVFAMRSNGAFWNGGVIGCRQAAPSFLAIPALRYFDNECKVILTEIEEKPVAITMYTHHTNFQRHASRCRSKSFLCDVCHSGFTPERDVRRHKRTVRCGERLPQPAPAPRVDLRDFIHENWTAVHKHVIKGLAIVDLKEDWAENSGWGSEVNMMMAAAPVLINE